MAMICNNIQSDSSSSQIVRKHYDVFVSFRGTDTRYNFTDHLFGALQRKGIPTFRDDKKLKKSQSIAPELLQAIEGSQVLIVVFSKNYASSTWCLRELVKILDCVRVSGKHVLPIFYDVDPSEVRKQSGDYEKAFAKHEERFKEDLEKMEEVKGWREALTQVGNLSGWDVRDKPQYTEIEKIVEEIIRILAHKFSSLPNDIIGMQTPVEEMEKVLLLSSVDDVRVVGISGMSGIGKTTLATVLYDRISRQYDTCCFIDDVSKTYKDHGPIGVQRQILHQTLNEENIQVWNLYNSTNMIRSMLQHVRALIVLDNVDHIEQLEKLAVNREWLGAGSRIIIISKDKHILNVYGADAIYKVPFLNRDNSIQLFCRKVFNCDDIERDYELLTYDVLEYVEGLPLAIKVLGSFLFDRDVFEWRSALARLRENPSKDVMDILQLSFDGLEKNEKEIFLDLACFFNKYSEAYVKNVLNCCGFHVDFGIRVLIEKSLVSIGYNYFRSGNTIEMHGLLQKLGMKIVQEEPRKWNRLWLHDYLDNVMLENMEENVEAIVLTRRNMKETKKLMAETLSKMGHLRLLILKDINFLGSLNCLSNELRYVEWFDYPFMYLPSTFQPNKLVELILKHSSIKQPWKGNKYVPNLKTLDLSHSKNLIKMLEFGEVPNLELLNLEGCIKLVQLDPSIGFLRKLIFLNLKDCKSLVNIPNNILGLSSLKYLNLSGCSKVFNNLMHVEFLKKLDTDETTLHSRSMSTIFKGITLPFHFLYPRAHKDSCSTSCLLLSLPGFSCLSELDISFCGLSQVPDTIGSLYCLDTLNLGGNNFVTLPSLKELSKLVYLNLQHCKQLKSLPELPSPVNLTPRKNLEQDHIFSNFIGRSVQRARLCIFNCPKLGDKERCNNMTFSWMIQVIQANQESFDPLDGIEIVTPGSEIPRWFHNQNVGSSISIDSSPMMLDNNCIGIACCVVLTTYNDPTITTNERKPHIIGIGFQCKPHERIYAAIGVLLDRELVTVKSDHMWLLYFTRKYYFQMIGEITHEKHDLDELKLEIYTIEAQGWHLEVKNIGYHWVFKHDLELLNLTMMHGGNSLARKRKFLVIEDESQP